MSFQNGSSVTYMCKYADCLKDQYRNLYFSYIIPLIIFQLKWQIHCFPKKQQKKKKRETSHEKQEIKILNPGSKDYSVFPRV